jgi:hypothetical protein
MVDAAQVFLQNTVNIQVWDPDKPEKGIAEIMTYKRNAAKRLAIDDRSLPFVCCLNWTAPCLINASTLDAQVNILSWALHENPNSVGLCLVPTFTYNKGKMLMEETKLLESLAKGNHNLDWHFAVIFGSRFDERDLRPLVYPGRFVFSNAIQDVRRNPFFSSNLRKEQRTAF